MTDMKTAPKYMHPGGRECVWNGGQWRYGANLAYVCGNEHPTLSEECTDPECKMSKLGRHFHQEPPECVNDRGSFGMPTLGNAARITWSSPDALTEKEVTHVPDKPSPRALLESIRMVVTEDGIVIEYGDKGENVDAATDDARWILKEALPPLLRKFLIKNHKYAEAQTGFDLGAKGIVPDLNRKFAVIKRVLWDEGAEVDEELDVVIDDLVGHLLLMKARLRR